MSRLIQQRSSIRVSFMKTICQLEEELGKVDNGDINVLKMLWRRAEDRFISLEKIDNDIQYELLQNELSQEEMDDEFNMIQEYRDKWSDINCRLDGVMKPTATEVPMEEIKRYKLPKLKLIEFSGCPKQWLSFWSQFQSIHNDGSLADEDKFQYLIQSTASESEARRVVSSFPPTATNYHKAINHLKSRFGKEKVLIEVYVRELLKLVLSNADGSQSMSLSTLYDLLETQLRALESLGVTTDNYAAMLYPMVESALSEDILRTWERIRNQRVESNNADQLQQLMQFLQGEVESDIRLKMAKRGITYEDDDLQTPQKKYRRITFEQTTATDLLNKERTRICVFCEGTHLSQDCLAARKISLSERLRKIREAGNCFKCLKRNHFSKECRAKITCQVCKGAHYRMMCNKLNNERKTETEINAISSSYLRNFVFLQTLLVSIEQGNEKFVLRALIDSGSGRSYITKRVVTKFGYKPFGDIEIAHSLFGGHVTSSKKHLAYNVQIGGMNNTSKLQLQLLDVGKICGEISSIPHGSWIQELKHQGITLSDYTDEEYEIDILIGADIAATLYTGKIHKTKEGPVAFETKLGWTLMGKCKNNESAVNNVLLIHSLHVSNAKVQDLWKLDIIGINDPVDNRNRDELARSALKHFHEKVHRRDDGRYEVELPWIEGHHPVGNNFDIAEKRLRTTMVKLKRLEKETDYEQVFKKWLELNIIEEVSNEDKGDHQVCYLPHHAVFNFKSSTTPIRPVFDASAKMKGFPSLNECLEKGPNLLELIPSILIRFRMKQYGGISDVEKAFLQIAIAEKDRDYLRFLWYKDGKRQIYRHCRVVFGIKSSPFLLAATLNYHMNNYYDNKYKKTTELLKTSTYVDNCVVSVDTKQELQEFMEYSTFICSEAKFNLRNWVWNGGGVFTGDVPGVGSTECGLGTDSDTSQETSNIVSVLGLSWNTRKDTLSLDLQKVLNKSEDNITKRRILAATHKIFDPLGFVSPITIVPKMILQEMFKKKFKWDERVPEDIERRFKQWIKELSKLQSLEIPRWVMAGNGQNKSLHVFTDASKGAYAAVAFMRSEYETCVKVQLVISKARVSTIKPISIPKLELVACECGAKMKENLKDIIDLQGIKIYFWSDSSNALSWIQRKENWQTFVYNRVKKIRELTNQEDWRHIPGHLNPADLPSRGCTTRQLIKNRWWEGPEWLNKSEEYWPRSVVNCDEDIVMAEKKKVVMSHSIQDLSSIRYFNYFSQFRKVVRMIAWMRRWRYFKRSRQSKKDLSSLEEEEAEICLWKMIQAENFDENMGIIKQLNAIKDKDGIWRVKTRLINRSDTEFFRLPILLPKNNIAVQCLIRKEHVEAHHCGQQTLRHCLRERFWIINSRVSVRSTIHNCGRCKRFGAKKFLAPEAPLPLNRVRDTAVFEVTGIDLGGPLYLIDEEKAWFVLFTCAVYRAVHLELVTALSTEGFLQALRRFIARRGRPEIIYTDNGTNFTGTENLMRELNWDEITTNSTARKIKWIFNPPSAPWWGGWWERIVRMVKQLLRCNLGRKSLNYEEMSTILCDCEQVINSRPLTYLTEDTDELIALSPIMFLNEIRSHEVIDLDTIEATDFKEKYKHRQAIRQELRNRFRKEYLSHLVHNNVRMVGSSNIKVGDIVLIEIENKKRIDWPIAEVVELFPGVDGVVRSVRLSTKKKEMIRAIQKLYLLETSVEELRATGNTEEVENIIGKLSKKIEVDKENKEEEKKEQEEEKEEEEIKKEEEKKKEEVKTTRLGRIIKAPERLSLINFKEKEEV